jgi:outer membrane protein OmpA-like peptidoglycan-associated protein
MIQQAANRIFARILKKRIGFESGRIHVPKKGHKVFSSLAQLAKKNPWMDLHLAIWTTAKGKKGEKLVRGRAHQSRALLRRMGVKNSIKISYHTRAKFIGMTMRAPGAAKACAGATMSPTLPTTKRGKDLPVDKGRRRAPRDVPSNPVTPNKADMCDIAKRVNHELTRLLKDPIQFKPGGTAISRASNKLFHQVATVAKRNPWLPIKVTSWSTSSGSSGLKLVERRARAAKTLLTRLGVKNKIVLTFHQKAKYIGVTMRSTGYEAKCAKRKPSRPTGPGGPGPGGPGTKPGGPGGPRPGGPGTKPGGPGGPPPSPEGIMKQMDTDGDGCIKWEEVKGKFPEAEFKKMDSNGDGCVKIEEIRADMEPKSGEHHCDTNDPCCREDNDTTQMPAFCTQGPPPPPALPGCEQKNTPDFPDCEADANKCPPC